jgi:hypothetical protein
MLLARRAAPALCRRLATLAAGEEIMRYSGIVATAVGAVVFGLASPFVPFEDFRVVLSILSLLCIALTAVGVWDMIQPGHSLKRNYPIFANIRFFLEKIRPEIRQYSWRARPTARRSIAPSVRSPISARKVSSTSARSGPSKTSTPVISSGSITQSRRARRKVTIFASSSAGPTASSPTRSRSSTSRR